MRKNKINPVVDTMNNKNFTNALQWWNYVRWFSTISFLSVGIIQMAIKQKNFPQNNFIYTLVTIMLLNIIYSFLLNTFKFKMLYILLHNLLDILIFSMVIYLTDGPASPLIWLYLIPILTSSITAGKGPGLWASFLSVVCLFMVLFLTEYKDITLFSVEFSRELIVFTQKNSVTLLSYVCLFFLVYFISSFLAMTLHNQNSELYWLNKEINKKNTDLVDSCNKKLFQEKQIFVDTILRTLQHEMNNPLTIISVNAELLLKEQGQSYLERAESIQNNITRIRSIVTKIENRYFNDMHFSIDPLEIINYHKARELEERYVTDYNMK
ncbi:HAMP domain-containing histidine kinase [candidate division KSB1 bacterium]|nr:HAMP domain-containing histidine kinase [candidate division KSB1 bacterium]